MVDFNSKYTGDEVESMLDVIESKQDVIEDLDTIREGASRGATALQSIPEEYVTETELESRGFATTTDLSGKVDKQTGKGLSTEDFTTYLKNKLEELSNYDDRNLTAAVNTLRQEFDTLLNGDTSTAIETFNEIIAFLDGVSESDNLASIIASIEQQIANKQDKIADLENINEKLELINSVIDEEGYLYSNGEKVDMRFTRSLLPVGTSIPANANLNTIEYVKIGKYYCSLNADAETITNCPVKVAFSMEVFNPLGTNVDDETTQAYTYRMRVLTQYNSGQQYLQFCRTGATPGVWTYDSWYVTVRSKSTLNSNKKGSSSALGSATQGVYLDSTGTLAKMTYTLEKSVPKNAVFTDTNTKVTAVGNHYSPAEDESEALNAPDDEVVVGLKRDAAGHIVGISTATATTATNISTAPTLAEKNGQITVKVGNKTSNPLTVPFATHAETATDLTGRIEATPEVFTYRPSAGEKSIKDDNAFIRAIKGNSVVWNQLVHGSTYPNTVNRYGLECSVKLNSREITVVGTYANDASTTDRNWYTANALTQLSTGIVGHIYLCRISGNKECSLTLYGWCAGTTDIFDTVILECTSATTLNIALKLPLVSDGIQINETIIVDIHDLTAMFGAGNEPTAEEFRALYPNSYYPYNTGELRNLSCFGIRTVGFNQWDEVWELGYISTIDGLNYDSTTCIRSAGYIRCFPNTEYYISDAGATRVFAFYDADKKFIGCTERNNLCLTPTNCVYIRFFVEYGTNVSTYNNDICINLHHTGYRDGEYERYKEVVHTLPLRQITGGQPLRKAGDVYDEINETEYIKRVGVVDLGSLEWESVYDSDTGLTTFAANRPTACVSTYKSADKANIFCTKYTTDTWNNIWSGKVDKAIGIAQSYIRLRDTSFTTSAALKASLSGVLLHYEFAEPIIKPIEIPLVLGYYVEDFGTEEAMLAENSAPFSADIIYQFNATDQVRNNTRNLHILQKKALIPSGTAAQYIRGDGSYADINADVYIADFTMVDIEMAIENAMENVGDNFSVDADGTKLWDAIGAHKQIVIPYSNYADIGGYYIVTSAYHDGVGHINLSIFTGYHTLNLRINKDYLLTNNKLNFNADSSVAQSIDWWSSYMTNEELFISTNPDSDSIVKRNSNGGIEATTIDANFFRDTQGSTWVTPTSSQDIRDSADYFFAMKKRAEPIFENDVNIEMLSPDKIYFLRDMSELTSLTIDDFEVRDDVNEYFIHFRTGEGGTTLSMPSSVYWANGEIPEIEPSTEYELSITLYNDGGQYVTKAVLTKFAQV